MGSTQNGVFWQRNRNPIVFIFVMLVLSSTHLRFMAEGGRPISGKQLTEEAVAVVNARQIGSRPPLCERRCGGCGKCVAVQVPIAPQGQSQRKIRRQSSITSTPKNVAYSRGDDITNYKPMSWKCKCGNLFFNP